MVEMVAVFALVVGAAEYIPLAVDVGVGVLMRLLIGCW
jgi:hypothetical protein